MTRNAKCAPTSAIAAVVIEAVVTYGRHGSHFLFEVLQDAYATHKEKVQMRLAPVKPRSWRENLPEPTTIAPDPGTDRTSRAQGHEQMQGFACAPRITK
ncbi:MAG TPA: hypothetical protein VGJ20_31335 [Xanthobacteraceae bacterium]|jgi:hypothetical protein